jgi:hypothetical protein
VSWAVGGSRVNIQAAADDLSAADVLNTTADTADVRKLLDEESIMAKGVGAGPVSPAVPAPEGPIGSRTRRSSDRGRPTDSLSKVGRAAGNTPVSRPPSGRKQQSQNQSQNQQPRRESTGGMSDGGGDGTVDFAALDRLFGLSPAPVASAVAAPAPAPAPARRSAHTTPTNRRQTADRFDIDELFRALGTPRPAVAVARRETADAGDLRQLMEEIGRSPAIGDEQRGHYMGVLQRALEEVEAEARASISPGNAGNVTADASAIRHVLLIGNDDDDDDAGVAAPVPSPSPAKGRATPGRAKGSTPAQQPKSGGRGRRQTADFVSVESLTRGVDEEEQEREGGDDNDDAPFQQPTPQRGARRPARAEDRRGTASPQSLAMLLDDLNRVETPAGARGAGAEQGDRDTPMSGSQGARKAKSPRLSRTKTVMPGQAAAAMAMGDGEGGAVFSMSPPPAVAPGAVSTGKRALALRSCLSSKKGSPAWLESAKKSVVFGSPDAVSFNKGDPAISLTPMAKNDVKRLFPQLDAAAKDGVPGLASCDEEDDSMAMDEDPVTAANTAQLAEWDELAASDDEVDDRRSGRSSTKRKIGSRSPRPKRRQSLLFQKSPLADEEDDDDEEVPAVPDKPLRDRLAAELEEDEEEEDEDDTTGAQAMDICRDGPGRQGAGDDMPDIRDRSPSFRSSDERTSRELGEADCC